MRNLMHGMFFFAAIAGPAAAPAIPIVYQGALVNDTAASGSVGETGTAAGDLAGGQWWFFSGHAGDSNSIAVRRLDGGLDAALIVWRGAFADTDLIDLSPGSVMLGNGISEVAAADDEAPAALPGPFGDPAITFTLPAGDTYSVLVWSFMSAGNGDYRYSISRSRHAVSAPATLLLVSTGLVLSGLRRRAHGPVNRGVREYAPG